MYTTCVCVYPQKITVTGDDGEVAMDMESEESQTLSLPETDRRGTHSTGTSGKSKKQTSKSCQTATALGSGILLQTSPKTTAADVSKQSHGGSGVVGVGEGTSVVVANVVPEASTMIEQSENPIRVVGGEDGGGKVGQKGKDSGLLRSTVSVESLLGKKVTGSKGGGGTKQKGKKKGMTQQGTPEIPLPPVTASTVVTTRRLFESEWDSSNEEEEMPFLDSSLLPGNRSPGIESTSSWESSKSEGEGGKGGVDAKSGVTAPTPNFLANISLEGNLGEQFEASGTEEERGFEFKRRPPSWLSDSESSSD